MYVTVIHTTNKSLYLRGLEYHDFQFFLILPNIFVDERYTEYMLQLFMINKFRMKLQSQFIIILLKHFCTRKVHNWSTLQLFIQTNILTCSYENYSQLVSDKLWIIFSHMLLLFSSEILVKERYTTKSASQLHVYTNKYPHITCVWNSSFNFFLFSSRIFFLFCQTLL